VLANDLVGQKGLFNFVGTITLAGNAFGNVIMQVNQGLDYKVVCIQTVQTGVWKVIWGTNTINFMASGQQNATTPPYCTYTNVFGTAILPHRYVGPGYDYAPIFPRGSNMVFNCQDTSGSTNTIEIVVEGIYDNWLGQ
jgi:hypothetical protein